MADGVTLNSLTLTGGALGSSGYAIHGDLLVEGEAMAWDAVRGDDGAWRQADLHAVPYALTFNVFAFGINASNLESNISALRTACLNGGTLTVTHAGGSKSYTVWPGQPPQLTYNGRFVGQLWVEETVTLTIVPA